MFKFGKKNKSSSSKSDTVSPQLATIMNDTRLLETSIELDFSKKGLTDKDLAVIAEHYAGTGGKCPLRALNLASNKFTNDSTPSIIILFNSLPLLTECDLSNNKLKGAKAVKPLHPIILGHVNLRILRLGGNDLGPAGTNQISETFQAAPNLLCVDLGWKTFAKSPTGRVTSFETQGASSSSAPQGRADLAPKRFMQLVSKHVLISPDGKIAKKLTGGDQFNSNIQWNLPEPDEEGCYVYTYQLHSTTQWVAVGWAPESIELDKKQYNKFGCYLTSTGFPCGPAGTASATLTVTNRGQATIIRAKYDPNKHVAIWQDFSEGKPGEVLAQFNEVSIYPQLYPTMCFGHQGTQVTMVGSSKFEMRSREVSDRSATQSLLSQLSNMSQSQSTVEPDPSFAGSSSFSGQPQGFGLTK